MGGLEDEWHKGSTCTSRCMHHTVLGPLQQKYNQGDLHPPANVLSTCVHGCSANGLPDTEHAGSSASRL